MYSALKKDGIALYKMAREGKTIERKARTVTIDTFNLTSIDLPQVHFLVDCTKGTYIRSLAHDFGQSLSNGAYLSSLIRTKIGEFSLEDANTMDTALKKISDVFDS